MLVLSEKRKDTKEENRNENHSRPGHSYQSSFNGTDVLVFYWCIFVIILLKENEENLTKW